MAVTRNPTYYLWVGAVFRWVGNNKSVSFGLLLCLVGSSFFFFSKNAAIAPAAPEYSPPPVQIVERSPTPAPHPPPPAAQQCNINRMPYHFGATRPAQAFNPGGVCAPALYFADQCVFVTQYGNNRTFGPFCDRGDGTPRDTAGNPTTLPNDIDRAWSAGAPFDGAVGLWQPRYTNK
jgi:hypothetical protein